MKLTLNRRRHILADGKPTGWQLQRGSYVDTSDDRADAWYIVRLDADAVRRSGPGYPRQAEALAEVQRWLERGPLEDQPGQACD